MQSGGLEDTGHAQPTPATLPRRSFNVGTARACATRSAERCYRARAAVWHLPKAPPDVSARPLLFLRGSVRSRRPHGTPCLTTRLPPSPPSPYRTSRQLFTFRAVASGRTRLTGFFGEGRLRSALPCD